MKFAVIEDLAMILPIPVRRNTLEKGVRFINLEKYPAFFSEMEFGFGAVPQGAYGVGSGAGAFDAAKLKVADVGSFEASFVPKLSDFSRLDERFRLPAGTWEKLPQYENFGFAVFKLKKSHSRIHPIAFEFPRANRNQIFFPTVHIHDGEVNDTAEFDHLLYAQFDFNQGIDIVEWTESHRPVGMFMDVSRCAGLMKKNAHVYKRVIKGQHKNEDVVI